MNVGFIGLGIMGKPMAAHILKAGNSLTVYNRSRPSVEELAKLGAAVGRDPAHVAETCDIIITMLPDSPDVKEVVLGERGLIHGLSSGKTLIDMSSIHPLAAQQIAQKLEAKGVHMLDAPVSGGEIGAIEATLAIMVGGEEEVFERCLPLLKTMGKSVHRVGEIGAGNTVKLMNQMIVAVNLAAVTEAFAFGKKAGIDPVSAYEAIKGGLAGSRVMDTKINNIRDGQYPPGFRVKLHAKDLRNVVAMAEETDAKLEFSDRVLELFNDLSEQGFSEEDHSSLHRLFPVGKAAK